MRKDSNFSALFDQRRPFILFSGVIILLILLMEIINKRFTMSDFEVYYYAAKAFVGDYHVYGQQFGGEDTGFYKYSPFALFFFIPLSLLPVMVAKVIFFLLIGVATVVVFLFAAHLLKEVTGKKSGFSNRMLAVVAIVACSRLHRELHMGNVNMILLLMLLLILWFILNGKQITAGVLFAIVLFIKPHFIILVPLFLLRRQYVLLAVTLAGIIVEIMLPTIFIGVLRNWDLHMDWAQVMMQHAETLDGVYNTIYSLFILVSRCLPSLELGIPDKALILVLLSIVAVVFGWFYMGNIRRERLKGIQFPGSFKFEFLILVALIPNLMNTDSEHFLLTIPLLFFLLGLINKETPMWFKVSVGFSMLLYGINIHDLIGHSLSMWLGDNGALGFSNILLILLSGYGYRRFVFSKGMNLYQLEILRPSQTSP
jgi:hypothetical protein